MLTLDLPYGRRRAITLELTVDDAGADRLRHALLALARRTDPGAKAAIADLARGVAWTDLSFVAVDVETTGFSPDSDRVIEVGWVRFDHGREVERFSSLVNAGAPIPQAVRALTGIDDAMLANKPSFADVAKGLVDVLASVDFAVAYNARFDRGFLAAELRRAGRTLPDVRFVDPLAFVRTLDDGTHEHRSRRLAEVARRFGVSMPEVHRAEHDARATGELLLKLAPRLGAVTLDELLDKQERWARLPDPEPEPEPAGLGARLLALFR